MDRGKDVMPRPLQPTAEMNITPLIDVLLVLLVIFLATVPFTQKGIDANLPAETRPGHEAVEMRQIVVEYTAERQLSINRQPVVSGDLESRLRVIFEQRADKTLYVSGAAALRYGEVIAVIDAAKGAGVQRMGIITEGMRRATAAPR